MRCLNSSLLCLKTNSNCLSLAFLLENLLLCSRIARMKAPGLDGLPAEFYKAFWDILGPTLLEVFQESVEQGVLPLTCQRAVLCLLPEKGNLHETANWRPVSHLNTDCKILSKALATCLKEVISFLIGTDQSHCVPERSIYDNIFLVRLDQSWSNYISWFWFITFRSRKSF